MGATSSIPMDVFKQAKEEYEKKKTEGLSDVELFEYMKNFLETKNSVDSPTEVPIEMVSTTETPTVIPIIESSSEVVAE